MPICIPEYPSFKNHSEREVWQALRDTLPSDAYLLSNTYLTDSTGDYEVDVIVAWPEIGIAVIETKGGKIGLDAAGQWVQRLKFASSKKIDPIQQVRRTFYGIRDYVSNRWNYGQLDACYMLAFPHTVLPNNFEVASITRQQLLDKPQLASAAEYVKQCILSRRKHPASRDYCELFVAIIRNVQDVQRDWPKFLQHRDDEVKRWTEQQFRILEQLKTNARFMITGPAGSGKTFLALEQTRRLARQGKKVGILCYSRGLSLFLEQITKQWPESERPTFVGTFHSFAKRNGVVVPSEVPDDWWERECATQLLQMAERFSTDDKWDAFVIDEGQDFHNDWWSALTACLHDRVRGGLFIFGDREQQLFGRQGLRDLDLATFVLNENVRNSNSITRLANFLVKEPAIEGGLEGPPVQFVECSPEDVIHAADDEIDPLLDGGWRPQDIAIITTGSRHDAQVERQRVGKTEYWLTFWNNDDIFYGHVTGIKGLERPVIVVAINGWKEPEKAREFLYVAVTRARDLLIICGDSDEIRRIGGEDFIAKLHENRRIYVDQ